MKRFHALVTASVMFAALGAGLNTAKATTIIGPITVNASIGDLSTAFAVENLINQDGLSANYVSGVTDFATFVASTTHTNPSVSFLGGWASTTGNVFPVTIDFDFGAVVSLTSFALWNDIDVQALGNFELFSSVDGTFTTLTSLGAFTGTTAVPDVDPAQIFDMADSSTQFLRIIGSPITNVNGLLNIGEVAFEGSLLAQVPEPGSLALFGIGLAGLGFMTRRRKRRQPVQAALVLGEGRDV